MNMIDLDNLVTGPDLERAFGVTTMTIYNWRKNKGLPSVSIPSSGQKEPIRFDSIKVLEWAEENGIEVKGSLHDFA